jgi:hypothetical protein
MESLICRFGLLLRHFYFKSKRKNSYIAETASIFSFHHIEQREGRWAIVDIVGKRDKMRTVPMPSWAKATVDARKTVAHLEERPHTNRKRESI